MGLDDKVKEGDLFNRWEDDNVHTLQAYVSKSPLLNDGARTAGTRLICAFNGTWSGTFAGTFLLPADFPSGADNIGTFGTKAGTLTFSPASGWAYVLHALSFTAVDPAADAGTLGTCTITGLRIEGQELGTTGAVSNFTTLFGEDLTLYGSLTMGYVVKLSGTALGTEGTWSVNANVSGWKFRTVD